MEILLSFTFFAICSELILGQEKAPLITISDGKLRGAAHYTIGKNVTYYAYRGIPFAKPAVGNLRFAAPVKNDPWTGILNATEDKDSCTQISTWVTSTSTSVTGSEDCLYINVYTTNVTGNLPVMVWIYGGTFLGGTSAYTTYKPDYFLEKDVIYVAFNYRLGVFGFLSTEDLTAPGNWGLKDQLLALKWVKKNIKHFGGDSNKVTIFGQSAGAASVSYLAQSNLTADLIHGAIMQSGTSLCSWARTINARRKAFEIGISLGIYTSSSKVLIQKLRNIDYKTLKIAENNITTMFLFTDNFFSGLPLGVVTEPAHPGAIVTSKSWELLSSGKFPRIPLIIGYTSNETAGISGYVAQYRPILIKYDIAVGQLAPYYLTDNVFKQIQAGLRIKHHYFRNVDITSDTRELITFFNVNLFERPIRETVVQTSKFSKVHYYEFAYKGYVGDPNNTIQGVTHAEDLAYEFVVPNLTPTAADRITIQKVVTLWTNFAKTGNPTPSNEAAALEGLIWEPNDKNSNASTDIKYLSINKNFTMNTNPFQNDWTFYQNIYKDFGDPPYTTY